jgi:hypothetical protein
MEGDESMTSNRSWPVEQTSFAMRYFVQLARSCPNATQPILAANGFAAAGPLRFLLVEHMKAVFPLKSGFLDRRRMGVSSSFDAYQVSLVA